MSCRFLAGLAVALFVAGPILADDPKFPEQKEYDKLLVETLKNVHNAGANLYNVERDYVGAFRVYQGALLTVRPLLAHRPAAQKTIDEGLAAAELEPTPGKKAFKLHETLEQVRTILKGAVAVKTTEPKKATETKLTETKKAETTTPGTKPATKPSSDTPKPAETQKPAPAPQYELAPMPREKKTPGGI